MKLSAPTVVDHYEIERRVAVEVLGLPDLPFDPHTVCPNCRQLGRYCGTRSWCSDCSEWYYHPYKNYRDSMDAAMEVVEKMGQRGWQIEVTNPHKLYTLVVDNIRIWCVRFVSDLDCSDSFEERSSLAEAICHAALKAVKGGKSDAEGTAQ